MDNHLLLEILFEKLQDLKKERNKVEELISLYKDWHLGSPMQQRTRKKSLDINSKKLPIIESKINLIEKIKKNNLKLL